MKIIRGSIALVLLLNMASSLFAQVVPVRPFKTSGAVKSISDGMIAITDRSGKSWQMRYSERKDGRISLGKKGIFNGVAPVIEITGSLPMAEIDKGFRVRVVGNMDDDGRLTKPASEVSWVDDSKFKPGIQLDRKRRDDKGNEACAITGTVQRFDRGRLTLKVSRSRYSPKGTILFPVARDAKLVVKSRDLTKVQEEDRISEVSGVELNTGDFIIQKIKVSLVATSSGKKDSKGKYKKSSSTAEVLEKKYEKLSDEPVAPRDVRSQHFIVRTDLSARKAKMLLDKLETMVGLVSRYYGRPLPGVIQCYVAEDLKRWPKDVFPEYVKAKMANNEGRTVSATIKNSLGARQTKSVVYSGSRTGTVQHEAVHAYCNLAFGSTGPTWYSEGMAEMGQYWKEAQREVDVNDVVIRHIRKSKKPKKLTEIIKPGQITGDSWEAYAWRWALCHLLANNPNYNKKFRDLGIGLMMERPGVSFTSAYGKVAKQLMFEYDQFVENVDNGYRADLCAWKWRHRFKDVTPKKHEKLKVAAKGGWQPGVRVEKGVRYDVAANGKWEIDGTGTETNANGDKKGVGKLVAVVMKDYKLSETIELGEKSNFVAPTDGELYFRCNEEWNRISDNAGGLTVYIRHSK